MLFRHIRPAGFLARDRKFCWRDLGGTAKGMDMDMIKKGYHLILYRSFN